MIQNYNTCEYFKALIQSLRQSSLVLKVKDAFPAARTRKEGL